MRNSNILDGGTKRLLDLDRQHIWHPYSAVTNDNPLYAVASANKALLTLTSGEELVDGMSSWWSVIHGYNHPELNAALTEQMHNMAHVMFGGLTHAPAVNLAKKLVDISPKGLNRVFFSDSGSVAVEVAMKMALQYWQSQGQDRHRFLSLEKGYHGDTFGAMSVCDPITGMHHLFSNNLMQQVFAPQPSCRFHEACEESDFTAFEQCLVEHKDTLAGVILEPVVQGTGGMHFYSPDYLKRVRELTEHYGIPLIADEIATGMGRTGKLFACEHADITPDIMCLGKTLSAGYITLAATLCTDHIANTICDGDAGVLMHGPTFMGNPLACAVANKSIDILLQSDWQNNIARIEKQLYQALSPCKNLVGVTDVRVLGSIGVVEMEKAVELKQWQPEFVKRGIWLRPFGKLIYTIPPYCIDNEQIKKIGAGIYDCIQKIKI